VDTWAVGEMYHVHDDLWEWAVGWRAVGFERAVGPGAVMLCIGCLEARLGRILTIEDFSDAPINWCPLSDAPPRSPRMLARLDLRV
jgi:hypothetical protein